MKLYLVRHGETFENANNITQGQSNSQLTLNGIEQAKKLAYRLKDEKFDCVYCSDLDRAVNTLDKILVYHPSLNPSFEICLRERSKGIFEGKDKSEIQQDQKRQNLSYSQFIPEGGESVSNLCGRIINFYEMLKREHSDDSVLIVSHGEVLTNLLLYLDNRKFEQFTKKDMPNNTALSIIELDQNFKPNFLIYNCDKHLE